MMPYAPIDTLHAMHREFFKDDVADRRANRRRDERADPLGLALTKLRPGLWLHDGLAWLVRLGRLAAVRTGRRTA